LLQDRCNSTCHVKEWGLSDEGRTGSLIICRLLAWLVCCLAVSTQPTDPTSRPLRNEYPRAASQRNTSSSSSLINRRAEKRRKPPPQRGRLLPPDPIAACSPTDGDGEATGARCFFSIARSASSPASEFRLAPAPTAPRPRASAFPLLLLRPLPKTRGRSSPYAVNQFMRDRRQRDSSRSSAGESLNANSLFAL
jgi:hypothetical protein